MDKKLENYLLVIGLVAGIVCTLAYAFSFVVQPGQPITDLTPSPTPMAVQSPSSSSSTSKTYTLGDMFLKVVDSTGENLYYFHGYFYDDSVTRLVIGHAVLSKSGVSGMTDIYVHVMQPTILGESSIEIQGHSFKVTHIDYSSITLEGEP